MDLDLFYMVKVILIFNNNNKYILFIFLKDRIVLSI